VDFKLDQEESEFAKKMKEDIYRKMNEEKTDSSLKPKEEIEVKEKVADEKSKEDSMK
jgi:hypothetical protein